MIISPLHLPRAANLIVVPDGALFYVPFGALQKGSRALIDDYEITVAPSASSIAVMSEAASARRHVDLVAVFADPVFNANDERVQGKRRAATPLADADLVRAVRRRARSQ
jgi:CHAT domain-containing protein